MRCSPCSTLWFYWMLSAAGTVVVRTSTGLVQGVEDPDLNASTAFLGIPYAEAPVGERRFLAPKAKLPWQGVLQANDTGPACWQKGNSAPRLSEDCLRLHIWTPNSCGELRPVMVFLHGGSLVKGSAVSIQAIDGGEKFLARGCSGVVSVALNYRLGVLGYLVVDGKANHGLLDTIEALRWIKTNIRAFGGDPERITIYGQSSGGSLVLALLASPLSNGLYSRAISMSGSPRLNSTLEEARDYWHQEVYQGTKCRQYARNATALRRCLLALTPHELTYAMPENWDPPQLWSLEMFSDKYVYAPLLVVDGEAIPSDYLTTFANDPPNDVPTAIGVTRQEVDFIPGTDARNLSADAFASLLFDSVEPYYGRAFADKLLDMYNLTKAKATQNGRVEEDYDPSKDMQLLFADIMNDASALCTTRKLVESMSRGFQSKVYFYAVSQLLSGPLCCMKPFEVFDYCPRYSYHAIDEFALFEWNDRRLFDAQAPDNQFSLMLQKWFINFALSGDNPEWVPFKEPRSSDGGETYAIMDFNNDFQILKNLKADECSFFLQHGFYESKAWVN